MKKFWKVFVGNIIFSIIILFILDMFSGVNVSSPDVSMDSYVFYFFLVTIIFVLLSFLMINLLKVKEASWVFILLAIVAHLSSVLILMMKSILF